MVRKEIKIIPKRKTNDGFSYQWLFHIRATDNEIIVILSTKIDKKISETAIDIESIKIKSNLLQIIKICINKYKDVSQNEKLFIYSWLL